MVGVRWAASAAPVALTALAVAACGESAAVVTDALETAVVERRTLEVRAEAAGLIEPIRLVEVKSRASGEVLQLHVETGDRVERGALLADIDPRDVRNALSQAEADLEVAKARLATTEAQLERSRELREANVITEQEFETATLDLANARSQLVKAQTNLQLARERMGDVTIRAPIDGTIIQKTVEIGQIIASASQNISGGTTLFQMADLSEMQVRTLVDETDIGRIGPGLPARVGVEAFPNRTFAGRVLKIEPQAVVEQNVTMFPVLVRLDNREGLLKPGMNAEVQIEIARRDDVLTVPNAAVVAMRDAMAAGAVLGLDEEAMRATFGRSRGTGDAGRAEGAAAAPAGAETRAPSGPPAGDQPVAAADDAAKAATDQAQASDSAAAAQDCAALRDRMRSGGGIGSLSEEDRARARECFQRTRGQATDGAGPPWASAGGDAAAGGSQPGEVRPGVIFIQGPNGPEPRRVLLGLNDWDHTEVVRGLDGGEQVILISVARLQAQQQQMLDRIRERSSGPIPGARGRR